jgi:serine/threonine-protein kinase
MSEVFLATTADAARRLVVLKIPCGPALADPAQVAMFTAEARLLGLVRHENVVALLAAGDTGAAPYQVLELVDGPSLLDLARCDLDRRAPMETRLAASLVCDAATGLHAAHEAVDERGEPLRVVHHDVCPANLLVSAGGVVKVADFGVAVAAGRGAATRPGGGVRGRVAYAAPEHVRGLAADRRADVFALGVVLWELLAGQRLFRRATAVGTLQAVAYQEAPPLSTAAPGAPPALDRIVRASLDKDPARRPSSAAALAAGLAAATGPIGGPLGPAEIATAIRARYGETVARLAWLADVVSRSSGDRGEP